MSTWLHWIGNQYYSIPSFIREARELGISRRVSVQTLKGMEWGDKVYLISREPNVKTPVIFGWFQIEKLQGIGQVPPEIQAKIEIVSCSLVSHVRRGCGTLKEGGVYAMTTADIEELADYADDPMIKGGLKIFPKPYPMMLTIPAFRGFRLFNEQEFLCVLDWRNTRNKKKRPRLKGCFYV